VIHLNNIYYIKKKEKNKHLSLEMYEKIQSEYNHYLFSKEKECGKTIFMKYLANTIGTTLSNLYEIIKVGMITTLDYELKERKEFSAIEAWNKRTKKSIESNSSKRIAAKPFIELVIKEFRSEYNINSIDEIINDLKMNRTQEIKDMETICTSTFYNYVDQEKLEDFDKKELPMKCKRKSKNKERKGKTKPKGTSIEQRPFKSDDRSEFGHWEGDTIVGSNKIKNSGAVFTLVERKTRFQITIKCKDRKALTILKAIKKIKQKYPDFKDYKLNDIFKSITFDNGVEFSRWKEIQKYLKSVCYFAHPYSSYERGSNENGNKLLRLFLPKSCNINEYTDEFVMKANDLINTKIRKILGYKSSLDLFNDELAKLTPPA
jgi:IS30 family transposase